MRMRACLCIIDSNKLARSAFADGSHVLSPDASRPLMTIFGSPIPTPSKNFGPGQQSEDGIVEGGRQEQATYGKSKQYL